MKASEARMLGVMHNSLQFLIPIYQRTYSWREEECAQLWDDVVRAGSDTRIAAHFVGSVVYVVGGPVLTSAHPPMLVIDGQQRLTTVTLLLEALARTLGADEPVDGFSALKIRRHYLLNDLESGERRYKLLLTQTDKASLIALLEGREPPPDRSVRVQANFDFFAAKLATRPADVPAVCRGLAKLMVVEISLNRDQDDPQLIFESLNSTGRELSQADLIRNHVLMGLEPGRQTRLYERFWRPMELDFGQDAYADEFDGFVRHYLTAKTGEIPNVRGVYEAFKRHAVGAEVEALVADVRAFARRYAAIALGKEEDAELAAAFGDLRELRVEVAMPLLLELYADHEGGSLSRDDFLRAVHLVESYVFRRAVCGMPPASLNKTFATFSKALRKDRYLESIEAHFLRMRTYRRFPTDDEFRLEIQGRDLYHFRSRAYWLRKMENHGRRREKVAMSECSVEHILPQNPSLSAAWQAELGPEWKGVQQKYLHTLGNLTLTGYNSEYGDRPFAEKRDRDDGFGRSPLWLNAGLGRVERWDEAAIRRRAEALAAKAVEVWPAPSVPADVLAGYGRGAAVTYTLADHPRLSGPLRGVFEAFRREVLALSPGVREEFFKHSVAYKAATNFVDVVPRERWLRLLLNMPFGDIDDLRGVCRDVSEVGHVGTGDVAVSLAAVDELPYVMGLVRQSLARQSLARPG